MSLRDDRTHLDDATLVAAALQDRQDFAPLYRRYLDLIYRYCYRRLGNREASEDATSQVFYQALTGLAGMRTTSFRSWLFTIAHNVVVDYARRHPQAFPLHPLYDPPDTATTPEEHAIHADQRRAVARALVGLSSEQQHVIDLRIAGLTGAEIAEVLGKSPAAVKMLQFRAMAHLRERLGAEKDTTNG